MKPILLTLLTALGLWGQISTTGGGSQSVILTSPTPITCAIPGTTVACNAPLPVTYLPVEVFGPAGTVVSAQVEVPTTISSLAGVSLWLQVHGLRYPTEASVQVNNSVWFPLATPTVTIQGLGAVYGGIGGGFATLPMTLPLPAGVVIPGINTVSFRFNTSDGISSGFRVLGLNFQVAGVNIIPATEFAQTDPTTWTPPLNDVGDIAAGLALFQGAPLTDTASGATVAIKAHCSDCHANDGRDLKYFNYSNNSIITRATFHGLTTTQGQQIASYIRSLTTPSPGLPWNPPYQPGAGMDSVPVANWSAGAGLSAVLPNDAALQPYLSNMSATAYLNPRETPLQYQFPDWNTWLPRIHPMDAFPTFPTSTAYTAYLALRTELAPGTPKAYKSATLTGYNNLFVGTSTFLTGTAAPTMNWTGVDSIMKWQLVKMWELNQDFGLEAMASAIYPKPNPRAWYGATAFHNEPGQMHIPDLTPMFGNGTLVAWDYAENVWNNVQIVLNDGQGDQTDSSPLDWSYVHADVKDLSIASGNTPAAMMELYTQIKDLQENTLNGAPPPAINYTAGFHVASGDPEPLAFDSGFDSDWTGYSAATRTALTTQYLQAWINQLSTYTPAQMWAARDGSNNPIASATLDCSTAPATTFAGEMWFAMPRLRYLGVTPAVMTQTYVWLTAVFPGTNWAVNKAMVCNAIGQCK